MNDKAGLGRHPVGDAAARSKQPPVIVIESDEGFESGDKTFGEAAMRQIRVKGLVALSIPGMRGAPAPDPPNTVNVLRHVFNKLFGTRYPMLRRELPRGRLPLPVGRDAHPLRHRWPPWLSRSPCDEPPNIYRRSVVLALCPVPPETVASDVANRGTLAGRLSFHGRR